VKKQASAAISCAGPVCLVANDQHTCCDVVTTTTTTTTAAMCTITKCPSEYTLVAGAEQVQCSSSDCSSKEDLDKCCSAQCTIASCPSGYKLNSDAGSVTCSSTDCSSKEDLDKCCFAVQNCTIASCPAHFHLKPSAESVQCSSRKCDAPEDIPKCCDAPVCWKLGGEGQDCNTVCGKCDESAWPTSKEEFKTMIKKIDFTCTSIENGGSRSEPDVDGTDCGWDHDHPKCDKCKKDLAKRCHFKPLNPFVKRFCPCSCETKGATGTKEEEIRFV